MAKENLKSNHSSPKKKQLVKVEAYIRSPYRISESTQFSLITHPDKGRKQVGNFLPCRDHVNDLLRNFVHKKTSSVYSYGENPPVDMDKLRLLIGRSFSNEEDREQFRNNIFSAKRLLNFYEKVAEWEQSKITTVNHSTMKYNAWLVTGPKEWLSYSQLTSMITLIFRIIGNYGPIEFSNNKDVERWFYNLIEQYKEKVESGIYRQDNDLAHYLPHCWNKFYMIMKHNKEIFTQPIEIAYPADGEFHSYGGITQLCRFDTLNATLDENMGKVCREYQERKRNEKRLSEEKLIIIESKSL